MLNLSLDK